MGPIRDISQVAAEMRHKEKAGYTRRKRNARAANRALPRPPRGQ
jgi:hypothetical protein